MSDVEESIKEFSGFVSPEVAHDAITAFQQGVPDEFVPSLPISGEIRRQRRVNEWIQEKNGIFHFLIDGVLVNEINKSLPPETFRVVLEGRLQHPDGYTVTPVDYLEMFLTVPSDSDSSTRAIATLDTELVDI
ncbi:MAG TPA: hypothetical protein VLE69_01215 [Candidatus Saccharimonadales bacterium]|nr:hypothetical protein [Candidatus Saccharimonadales bacterium]